VNSSESNSEGDGVSSLKKVLLVKLQREELALWGSLGLQHLCPVQ